MMGPPPAVVLYDCIHVLCLENSKSVYGKQIHPLQKRMMAKQLPVVTSQMFHNIACLKPYEVLPQTLYPRTNAPLATNSIDFLANLFK